MRGVSVRRRRRQERERLRGVRHPTAPPPPLRAHTICHPPSLEEEEEGIAATPQVPSALPGGLERDGYGGGSGGQHDRYGARVPIADYHSPWEDTLEESDGEGEGEGGKKKREAEAPQRHEGKRRGAGEGGEAEGGGGGGMLKNMNQRLVHLLTNPNVQFAWQF